MVAEVVVVVVVAEVVVMVVVAVVTVVVMVVLPISRLMLQPHLQCHSRVKLFLLHLVQSMYPVLLVGLMLTSQDQPTLMCLQSHWAPQTPGPRVPQRCQKSQPWTSSVRRI